MKFKSGDKVTLRKDSRWALIENDQWNPVGIEGTVTKILTDAISDLSIFVDWTNGKWNSYNDKDLDLLTNQVIIINNQHNMTIKQLIKDTAEKLLKAANQVTTLEIKTQLRTDYPYNYWTQENVSKAMAEFADAGDYVYTDNGTHRIYHKSAQSVAKDVFATQVAAPASKKAKKASSVSNQISRTKALDMMKNNKGRFFTVEFTKQDGSNRVLNGQYMNTTALGYVEVKEAGKMKKGENPIRNVNLQTLKTLKIGGVLYKVK